MSLDGTSGYFRFIISLTPFFVPCDDDLPRDFRFLGTLSELGFEESLEAIFWYGIDHQFKHFLLPEHVIPQSGELDRLPKLVHDLIAFHLS